MSNAVISVIGLCLDIVGVVLLWRFGLPPDVRRGGVGFLMLQKTDEREAKRAAMYDRLSHVALALIVIGFVAQAVGTALPSDALGRSPPPSQAAASLPARSASAVASQASKP